MTDGSDFSRYEKDLNGPDSIRSQNMTAAKGKNI